MLLRTARNQSKGQSAAPYSNQWPVCSFFTFDKFIFFSIFFISKTDRIVRDRRHVDEGRPESVGHDEARLDARHEELDVLSHQVLLFFRFEAEWGDVVGRGAAGHARRDDKEAAGLAGKVLGNVEARGGGQEAIEADELARQGLLDITDASEVDGHVRVLSAGQLEQGEESFVVVVRLVVVRFRPEAAGGAVEVGKHEFRLLHRVGVGGQFRRVVAGPLVLCESPGGIQLGVHLQIDGQHRFGGVGRIGGWIPLVQIERDVEVQRRAPDERLR